MTFRTVLIAAFLSIGLSSICLAQDATAPDTKFPPHYWVYHEIDVLQKAGIYIGKTGTGDGQDLTPNDIATALIYLLPLLAAATTTDNNFLIDAKSELNNKIDTNLSAIDALLQLLYGFAPEIEARGKDTTTARAFLTNLMQREINREELASNDGDQPHNIPEIIRNVPANQWAFHSVDILQKAGVVLGSTNVLYSSRPVIIRSELARDLAQILSLLRPDNSNLTTKDNLAAAKDDLQSKLDTNPDAIDALRILAGGFEPELTALGEDVPSDKMRLNSLEARCIALIMEARRVHIPNNGLNIIGPAIKIGRFPALEQEGEDFPDNLSNHWAYQAISVLRGAGFNIGFSQENDLTREEIANGVAVILPLMWQDETDTTNPNNPSAPNPYLQNKIDTNPELLVELDRLVDGFKPDLIGLGINFPAAKLRLDHLMARETAMEDNDRVHSTSNK